MTDSVGAEDDLRPIKGDPRNNGAPPLDNHHFGPEVTKVLGRKKWVKIAGAKKGSPVSVAMRSAYVWPSSTRRLRVQPGAGRTQKRAPDRAARSVEQRLIAVQNTGLATAIFQRIEGF